MVQNSHPVSWMFWTNLRCRSLSALAGDDDGLNDVNGFRPLTFYASWAIVSELCRRNRKSSRYSLLSYSQREFAGRIIWNTAELQNRIKQVSRSPLGSDLWFRRGMTRHDVQQCNAIAFARLALSLTSVSHVFCTCGS